MASRNQNKPPPTAARSPGSTKKENLDEMQLDKRRKIGVGKPAAGLRPPSRQALVTVNSDAATVCGSDAGSVVAGGIEFSSREDVERLLGEKMKGKNKTDFKGKCEQMLDYIKRLRVCIQWLIDREDGYVLEEKRLQEIIQAEEAKYSDMEGRMRRKEEELSTMLGELTMNHASLKEKLKKEEADKKAAIESYEKEKEARGAAERFRDALSVELSKAQKEATNAHQQIKTLQDINRRSQDYNASLQEYNSRLQNDATANNEAITKLQMEKNAMTESLSDLRAHFNSVQDQLVFLRASQQEIQKEKEDMKNILEFTRNDLQQVREDRNVQLLSVQSLTSDLEIYKQCNAKYVIELDEFMRKNSILEATCSSQKDQIEMLQNQLNTLNGNLQLADSTSMRTRIEYDEQKKLVEDLQRRLADADLKIVDGERLRKKLHNTILELKGNIRVFCRVRPLLPDHDTNGHETTTAVSYPASIELQGRGIDLMHGGKKLSFTFDKVFDHGALQEDVFVEISQLVQSALDGYKVCIFAYGQTGSGKTYTMMGKQDPDLKGLIPRSLEQVFETSQSLSCQGWTYKMQASMLEIYNETIRDLLASNRPSGPEANAAAAGKQYIIKHDQNGNTHVSDLTVVDVCSIREVSYLLQQAANSRSVGRTQMNEQSSRSHFVFILRIYGDNESTDQHVQGVLNLIDLAGSERLDKSGSMGDRLKETQHINKSLLSLSEVISSIAKKEDHIPFRNSKLTYLLQPCLGGESKTLMFVNISPESSSTGESKCSLQFASKVNSCEIGIPRRQTQTRS